MDNKSYRAYLKELGLKEEQPILINQFAAVDYSEGRIKVIQGKLLKVEIIGKSILVIIVKLEIIKL